MDWIFNIYHLLVDFFLIPVYFFVKLGAFIKYLFSIITYPFTFIKDFLTNINLNVPPADFPFPFLSSQVIDVMSSIIFIGILIYLIKKYVLH